MTIDARNTDWESNLRGVDGSKVYNQKRRTRMSEGATYDFWYVNVDVRKREILNGYVLASTIVRKVGIKLPASIFWRNGSEAVTIVLLSLEKTHRNIRYRAPRRWSWCSPRQVPKTAKDEYRNGRTAYETSKLVLHVVQTEHAGENREQRERLGAGWECTTVCSVLQAT